MSDNHSGSPAAGEAGTVPDSRSGEDGRSGERWLDRLMAAVGLKPNTAALRESLEEVLADEAAVDDSFSAAERGFLRNILRLRETRAEDVMVPRADVHAVADDITLADLLRKFTASAHSRLPVFRETLDDANAMVHIRDVMDHITRTALTGDALDLARVDLSVTLAAAQLIRPVLSVPSTMPATDLLARMQAEHIQMALIIDEFGGVDGLVSMEDIFESVVGDIADEHDVEDAVPEVQPLGGDCWSIDGLTQLATVKRETGLEFSGVFDEDEDIETMGGVVTAVTGHVPVIGEVVTSADLPGLTFEVTDADSRRVKRVKVTRAA